MAAGDLAVFINLFTDNAGVPGSPISSQQVTVGQTFFVEISVQDTRPAAEGELRGLVSFAIDVGWDAASLEEIDDPFNPTDLASPLLPASFTLFRSGTLNNLAGTITGLGGGRAPTNPPSNGIGAGVPERFSLLRFLAQEVTAGPQPFVVSFNEELGGALADGSFVLTAADIAIQAASIEVLPLPTLSIDGPAEVVEGDSGTTELVFTVTLSRATDQTVTVYARTNALTATAGADFTSVDALEITFEPGGPLSRQVTVSVTGDTIYELDETLELELFGPVHAELGASTAIGTILNDDGPPAAVFNEPIVLEGNPGQTVNAVFVLTLSEPAEREVVVNFSTRDNTAQAPDDYLSHSGQLVFTPGETEKRVTVQVTGDNVVELDETFFLDLTGDYTVTLVGTILNDDTGPPTVSISDADPVNEADAATVKAVFRVSLSAPSNAVVTVQFQTQSHTAGSFSDFSPASGVVMFQPGQVQQTISVTILDDGLDEDDETFFVSLSSPTNAVLGRSQATGVVVDDDPPPTITVNAPTVFEPDSGVAMLIFSIGLSAPSSRTVRVDVQTADGTATAGSDYDAVPSTQLVFNPGEVGKQVVVLVRPDNLDEDDETVLLVLSNPQNAILPPETMGVGIIFDNDPTPTATISGATVVEGDAGTVEAVFTVTLSQAAGRTLIYDVRTIDDSAVSPDDYLRVSGPLVIPAGRTTAQFAIFVFGDLLREGTEQFFVELTDPRGEQGPQTAVGVILDDDDPFLTIDDVTQLEGDSGQTPFVFTLTLRKAPVGETLVTVLASTADVTARAGEDYEGFSLLVVEFLADSSSGFALGETVTVPLTVLVNGDTLFEPDETFEVRLSDASLGVLIQHGVGLGTILNDDAPPLDFGDAPDSYGTLLASNGARHEVRPGEELFLGALIDVESDGQPTPDARGDDANGAADEDGVVLLSPRIFPGATISLQVTASGPGKLDAWLDADQNGTFDGDEKFLDSVSLVAGINVLQVAVPASVLPGATFARFRFSSAGGLGPTGLAADGEVEDYQVEISGLDFGDAPASYGTLLADNGPRHALSPLFLGTAIDAEGDGLPGTDALGDDQSGSDDEDGVRLPSVLERGRQAVIVVTASAAGMLDAWIDYDGNGRFEAEEHIFGGVSQAVAAGDNSLGFTVPVGAVEGGTYARFRLSSAGGLAPTGLAPDGEVEDYRVEILTPPLLTDARADHYCLEDGQTELVVPAPGVLGNDSGAGLTAMLLVQAQFGVVVLNSDGSFTYTPGSEFERRGIDRFTYAAVGQGGQDSALAVIESQLHHFVTKLYRDVLGREGEEEGIAYWFNKLLHGASRAEVARGFLNSDEYQQNLIRGFYRALLGREPGEHEVQFWLHELRKHGSEARVLAGIAGSLEYSARHPGGNAEFLAALFRDLLGREIEPQALRYWLSRLAATGSRAQVALEIIQSEEFLRLLINEPSERFAGNVGWYQAYLKRAAEAAGLSFWLFILQHSRTWRDVQVGILASAEYYQC
ncbi:MAG: DUF4214 domain-containing protein [Pirellulales bacterium]|nr:DUF4214 domain-containing protein [Pirellulales bacterium]